MYIREQIKEQMRIIAMELELPMEEVVGIS